MISKLTIPTIHWNGTSKDALEQEYRAAHDAVDVAIEKLQAITVHGRDYYVQDDEAGIKAMKEHYWRFEQLEGGARRTGDDSGRNYETRKEGVVMEVGDYSVIGQPGDSVYLLVPHNAQAKANLEPGTERWQWWGGGLAVEHRYIRDVIAQLKEEGWRVD